MAIDFPASPTLNQQFTSAGSTWLWDGVAWNLIPQMTPATASDTPPANPAIGQMWWRASNGQLYIWYDDGNSAQWVQTSTAVAPVPGAWETIYNGTFTCASNAPFMIPTLMGAFQKVKVTFDVKPGVNDDTLYVQFSADGGTTWYTTSGDYVLIALRYLQSPSNSVDGFTSAAVNGNVMGGVSPSYGGSGEFIIPQFNKAENKVVRGTFAGSATTSSNNLRVYGIAFSKAFALNAARFLNSVTTAATVNMLVEGVRG